MVLLLVDPSLNAIAFEVPPRRTELYHCIWGKLIPTPWKILIASLHIFSLTTCVA